MGIEKIKEIKVENGHKPVLFTSHANTNRAYLSQPKDSVNFTGLVKFKKVMSDSLVPKQKARPSSNTVARERACTEC